MTHRRSFRVSTDDLTDRVESAVSADPNRYDDRDMTDGGTDRPATGICEVPGEYVAATSRRVRGTPARDLSAETNNVPCQKGTMTLVGQ